MNVEVFSLCDAATDSHGKLNILGVFDTIYSQKIPSAHPQCAIAIRLRLARSEGGDHKFAIQLVDQDGAAIMPAMEGNFGINFDETARVSATVNLILYIHNLQLKNYGDCAINLVVDGRHEAALPWYIKPAG